ncbi:MAG: hypothetical protein V3W04_00365 [Gammaproteobacteria bacterium]
MSLARQLLSHGFLVAAVLLAVIAYIFRADLFDNQVQHRQSLTSSELADTAVVMTAEEAAQDELQKQVQPSTHSQSDYRPETQAEIKRVDIDDEIKAVAPPVTTPVIDIKEEQALLKRAEQLLAQEPPVSNQSLAEVDVQQATEITKQPEAAPVTEQARTTQAELQQAAEIIEHPEVATDNAEQIAAQVPHAIQPVPAKNQPAFSNTGPATYNRPAYGTKPGTPPVSYQQKQRLDSQIQEVLYSAREAFWNGSVDKAESLYKSLIGKGNTSPDVYGELGNVYYANGKLEDAATMYYEAGVRLSEQQHFGPAMHMVSILKGLKSDKAALLEKTVTGAVWPAQ